MTEEKNGSITRLTPLPNGPLVYENPVAGRGKLLNSSGQVIQCGEKVRLCRCGASSHMPFCDKSHEGVGFNSSREHNPRYDRRKEYAGESVTIYDNRYICAHSGYCWDGRPEVFAVNDKPWIHPDAGTPEDILRIIEICPSGALACAISGVEYVDFDRPPHVTVARHGPYYAVGGIELGGVEPWPDRSSREHYACCRCGGSGNKPFCDGSHFDINFQA